MSSTASEISFHANLTTTVRTNGIAHTGKVNNNNILIKSFKVYPLVRPTLRKYQNIDPNQADHILPFPHSMRLEMDLHLQMCNKGR